MWPSIKHTLISKFCMSKGKQSIHKNIFMLLHVEIVFYLIIGQIKHIAKLISTLSVTYYSTILCLLDSASEHIWVSHVHYIFFSFSPRVSDWIFSNDLSSRSLEGSPIWFYLY